MPLYRDVMTLADRTSRRLTAAVSALWPGPAWRATGNALAAFLVALVGGLLLGVLALIWLAAVDSLIHWPVGGWVHAVEYIAMVLAGPVLALWAVQGLAALQRSRLRATLGLDIPVGPRAPERKPWPVGPWLSAATWRQLGFHLLALLTGLIGGGLVAACWLAPVAAIGYLAAGHPPTAAGAAAVAAAAGSWPCSNTWAREPACAPSPVTPPFRRRRRPESRRALALAANHPPSFCGKPKPARKNAAAWSLAWSSLRSWQWKNSIWPTAHMRTRATVISASRSWSRQTAISTAPW
jgi:hypothetical protein